LGFLFPAAAQNVDYYLNPCDGNDILNRDLTLAQLEQHFGAENVNTEVIWINEGTEQEKVTYLFPGTKNEMMIYWTDTENASTPYKLEIRGEGADWYTINDITIGTPLTEIEKINGGSFSFAGLGWYYGGTVWDWKGGKLDGQCFDVVFSGGENPPQKLMGDMELQSDNPAVQKANLSVYSFIIHLNSID
jgi:hypothetical protein